MTTALIIVDVQNDFCEGSLAVKGGTAVAQRIVEFLVPPKENYDYIVTTQDWHINPGDHFSEAPDYVNSWPAHCAAGTWGAELHEAIKGIDVHGRFFKGAYSAAYSGFEGFGPDTHDHGLTLSAWLLSNNVDIVDVCGIATDYCVKATALDAVKAGFDTALLTELCAAVGDDEAAICEMSAAGVLIV